MGKNANLKNENSDLQEKINNLSYILADLQGKVKNAEQEKESLTSAMRLLVEDLNATSFQIFQYQDRRKRSK